MEHPSTQTAIIMMIAGVGLILAGALLVAMFFFRAAEPDDNVNLYPEAHRRAVQAERQAIKEGRP